MLATIDATAMLAVRDLGTARAFYGEVLGFELREERGVVLFDSGRTPVALYESGYAGTNEANALAWSVGERFDEIVSLLRERGVTFEQYDLPGLTVENGVHAADGFKGVWFKDPDGNILHVNVG